MTPKWHGWARPDRQDVWLCIGPIPERKYPALYVEEGNQVAILAYFRSEADARAAMMSIDALLRFGDKIVARVPEEASDDR